MNLKRIHEERFIVADTDRIGENSWTVLDKGVFVVTGLTEQQAEKVSGALAAALAESPE